MSDKVRIHDLAKQYGMSGKDLASKLRDFGFSKARSHMSALDPFDLVTAQGVLEANGISPAGSPAAQEAASTGGLKVIHRRKKTVAEGGSPPPEAPAPEAPAPASEPAAAEPVAPTTPPAEAPAPAAARPAPAPAPAPAPGPARPEPAPASHAEAPAPSVEDAPAMAAAAPAAPAPTPAPAPAPAPAVESAPAAPTAAAPEAPAASDAAPAAPPAPAPAVGDAKGPSPRGNVVGFVDPATFQSSQPKRRASSRRLQSRDDAAPDVRPTFGRGPGARGPQQAHTGPRGKLTAAQLREREQGRFLRRNRTSMTGQTQGRRTGGGRRGETALESPHAGGAVTIDEPITVTKLADALALKAAIVIKKCFQTGLGMFNQNQNIDSETATLLAAEFEVELDIREDISIEQLHLDQVRARRSELEEGELVDRPPTVAFLGHVDHGKTTLIDKIRETRVAEGESGGITQHVGAYQVTTSKGHLVTVVDTPGHEAFTSMRARGAKAVDIVVLVVAGDDGVKPSTVEAINHAKAASTPIVVAINKADKPDFNANAVIQQLMGHDLVPEQYGGKTAMFHTSGISGVGIDELLEHIFLMGELELGLKAHPKGPASGVVLEAEIQQGRGIVAHLLIQDGTLNKGDVILAGEGYGKVRQILNDRLNPIAEAGPSMPVAVTGLDALPGVGDPFFTVDALAKAKEIATERNRTNRAKLLADARDPRKQLQALLNRDADANFDTVNIIVRADVQGTAEVIKSEIAKLQHDEVEMKVIHSGVGPITESDVDLATPSGALLLAFHVGVNGKARQMADRAGLDIKRYEVIYELLDDLRGVMEGSLKPEYEEVINGHAEIRAIFKSSRIGLIAGCMVLDGSIKRNSKCRLMRDGSVVYTGQLGSLKREKEDAKEVREGFECGIVLKDYRDIRVGDVVETYSMKEIKRSL